MAVNTTNDRVMTSLFVTNVGLPFATPYFMPHPKILIFMGLVWMITVACQIRRYKKYYS